MHGIDLNADLGEGYGVYRCGDDIAILDIVTSANVACGLHAGDPEIMAQVFAMAKARGVAIGAHPGFPDLWGFGRRKIPFTPGEIERLVAYQIGAAQALAVYSGARATYVKCHGALSNICETDAEAAEAVGRAMKIIDPSLIWLTVAVGEQTRAAEKLGIPYVCEIFADRGYSESGALLPRGEPGAYIYDPKEAAARVLTMLEEQAIITASGARKPTPIGSVCVHGDNPQAVEMAKTLRNSLEAEGYVLRPFAPL